MRKEYLSLDNFSILEQTKTDPSSLWIGVDHIIPDEVQKAPELFGAVQWLHSKILAVPWWWIGI